MPIANCEEVFWAIIPAILLPTGIMPTNIVKYSARTLALILSGVASWTWVFKVEASIIVPKPANASTTWAIKKFLFKAKSKRLMLEIRSPAKIKAFLFLLPVIADVKTAPAKLPAPAAESKDPKPLAPESKTFSATAGINV